MKIRSIIIIMTLLALVTATAGGYLYYYSMREAALMDIVNETDARLSELTDRIAISLSGYQKMAAALAGLKELPRALAEKNARALSQANAILDHFQRSLNVDACYLMDRFGNTVASSNRNTPESFVGQNYAFRPYFKQALEGHPAVYPGKGVFTGKRGVFYSHPVYGRGRRAPIGVAVIKTSIDLIDKEINKKFDGVMLLVDPQGVVFVSSRQDWLYHVLWKTSPDVLSGIAASRQFGKGPFEWTGVEKIDEYRAMDKRGDRYRVHEKVIVNFPGWKAVYLFDLGTASKRLSVLMFKNYTYIIVLFCIVIGFTSIVLYRKANQEILRRRQAEEKLQSSNDRLQALIKGSPLPIVILDVEGIVTLWNPAAEQVFGWSEQEILGRLIPIIPGDKREEFIEIRKRIFSGQSFKALETQRMRKDGTRVAVSLSTAPLHDSQGKVIATMGIFEDISDRKKAEEERLKGHMLESIGLLAGGIAHDFNNLLSVILGNIAMAKISLQPGDKAFSRLADAENVCEIAGELSKRLITFATGGDPVKKTARLSGLIAEAVNAALKGSHIHTAFVLPEGLSMVAIDEGQMKQVFKNLAINAKEAMPEGGTLTVLGENVRISAQDTFPMRAGSYLKISVRDTGAGISSENLSKIFDPYYTTKDTYSQRGLGLGLAVCYSIIKRHDGLITVESEVGKGTTYHIYLSAIGQEATYS